MSWIRFTTRVVFSSSRAASISVMRKELLLLHQRYRRNMDYKILGPKQVQWRQEIFDHQIILWVLSYEWLGNGNTLFPSFCWGISDLKDDTSLNILLIVLIIRNYRNKNKNHSNLLLWNLLLNLANNDYKCFAEGGKSLAYGLKGVKIQIHSCLFCMSNLLFYLLYSLFNDFSILNQILQLMDSLITHFIFLYCFRCYRYRLFGT